VAYVRYISPPASSGIRHVFATKNCLFLGILRGYGSPPVLTSENVSKTISKGMGVVEETLVVRGLIRGVCVVDIYW